MAKKSCVMTASSVRNGKPLTENDKKDIFARYFEGYCQIKGIENYVICDCSNKKEK